MHQDNEDVEVSMQEFDALSLKVVNFYSVRPVIFVKVKTRCCQKDMCKYNLDIGSDGNPMPIRIY